MDCIWYDDQDDYIKELDNIIKINRVLHGKSEYVINHLLYSSLIVRISPVHSGKLLCYDCSSVSSQDHIICAIPSSEVCFYERIILSWQINRGNNSNIYNYAQETAEFDRALVAE